jgi:cyclopropane-fatty-acyl-phospholipid synthase
MSDLAPPLASSGARSRHGWLTRRLRAAALAKLGGIDDGRIELADLDGTRLTLGADPNGGSLLSAAVRVHEEGFWWRLAMSGSVGAGESYMDGQWDCDDLVALVRILLRNRERLDALDAGAARLRGILLKALHALRRNTRRGSRRNIAAHYDLGNDFFRLFLDRDHLMYSCAMYEGPEETLESAQRRRLEVICRKLELAPGDHLLEIGSGWGGFACYAAERHGCRVTTATISRQQYEYCRRLVAERGLEGRVEVVFSDYRDLEGRFDKLVSLEMIEAVGHEYLPTYFAKIADLLAPHGMALVQAITIEERRYEQARRSVDFIKRHIFPGSFIPAVAPMMAAIARASDLKLFHLEDIGPSYALTLREWRRRFLAAEDRVAALGFDRRFRRMWEFYLAYCEGGFAERVLGDVQMLLVKPLCRRAPLPSAA